MRAADDACLLPRRAERIASGSPEKAPPSRRTRLAGGCASAATAPGLIEVLFSRAVPPGQILMWTPRRWRGHMRPSQNSTWASANASEPP